MSNARLVPPRMAHPPTEWDRSLIELLQPIAERGTSHRALFYANTFPLAYHYMWALWLKNHDETDLKQVRFGAWEDIPPEAFGYASSRGQGDRVGVLVTTFQPRYVFVGSTMGTRRLRGSVDQLSPDESNAPVQLDTFLAKAANKYERFYIHAELPELGDCVSDMIPSGPSVRVYGTAFNGELPIIPDQTNNDSSVRLFVYGGALSSYLRGKTSRYFATRMDSAPLKDKEKLKTLVVLPSDADSQMAGALAEYNRRLFADAAELYKAGEQWESAACPPFYSVYRAYNDLARLLQHRSSFKRAWHFAECLVEHHDYSEVAGH